MSNTPETDKQWADWLHKLKMPIESFIDFARKLERERDEAREERDKLQVMRLEVIAANKGAKINTAMRHAEDGAKHAP